MGCTPWRQNCTKLCTRLLLRSAPSVRECSRGWPATYCQNAGLHQQSIIVVEHIGHLQCHSTLGTDHHHRLCFGPLPALRIEPNRTQSSTSEEIPHRKSQLKAWRVEWARGGTQCHCASPLPPLLMLWRRFQWRVSW